MDPSLIDWAQTTTFQTGIVGPTPQQVADFLKVQYQRLFFITVEITPDGLKEVKQPFFSFVGPQRFDNIIRAIDVIEEFLRKKHRLCYGGQAINAHLPAKYKFYNPEFSIPDYDFFTPNHESDITTLVKDLKKAGFTEISVREGMHDGTANYKPQEP